jgi:hypothetical protein
MLFKSSSGKPENKQSKNRQNTADTKIGDLCKFFNDSAQRFISQ